MLSNGQYFFIDIEQEGILLYDAGNTPIAERKPLSLAEAKAIAQYSTSIGFTAPNCPQRSLHTVCRKET